jgi:hypothetical protein
MDCPVRVTAISGESRVWAPASAQRVQNNVDSFISYGSYTERYFL